MVLTKFTGSTPMNGSEDSLFKIVGTTMKHFASYVYLKALQAGESIRLRVYNKVDDVSHWKLDGDVLDSVASNNGTITNVGSWISQWKFDGNVNDSVGSNNGTITYHTNLKRLYKFESNLNDSTTSAANGTLGAGTATYVTGQEGSAFSFDGSSYITASDTGLPTGTNVRSLSNWLYITTFSTNPAYFQYGAGAGASFRFFFDTNGKLNFNNSTSSTIISTTTFQINTWYHVVVVYDGTNALCYINGVLDKTTAITVNTTLSGATGINIGSFESGGQKMSGKLDELRVYNITLSAAQVSALYMNGKFGQSHTFDGGEYVTTSAVSGSVFTWSYWIKQPSFSGNQVILAHVYGSSEYLSFIDSSGRANFDITGFSSILTSIGTITAGIWNHVAFVYDGTKIYIYINGMLDSSISYSLSGTESSTTLIGARAGVGSPLIGQLDEVRIFSTALNASQILGLYNYTGSNYITPLPVGNALSLDGSSYVTVTNQTPYNFDVTNPFSISCWVKTTNASSGFDGFVTKNQDGTNNGWYVCRRGTFGTTQFVIRANGSANIVNGAVVINDGNWHNILVTYSGNSNRSGMKIYVDGVLDTAGTSNAMTTPSTNSDNVVIGNFATGTDKFTGLIDEVQIFNYVVSSAEINAINAGRFANTHNIGYWKFDGDLYDYSGKGSTGNPTGTMTYVTGALSGSYTVPNTHFNFDGSEIVDAGTANNLNFEWTQPFTITCWLRTKSTSSMFIIAKFLSVSTGWIGGVNGTLNFQVSNVNNVNDFTCSGSTSVNDGLWHFCVISYDGSGKAGNVKFYVDSNLDTTSVGRNNLSGSILNTAHVVIGALDTSFNNPFVGEIEDLRVYNRALSSAEVSDLYTYPDSAMKSLVYDRTYSGVKSDAVYIPMLQGNQYLVTAQQTSGTNRIVSWEREEVN